MQELHKGDLVISNDLMGFVVDVTEQTVLLNTRFGQKQIKRHKDIVVMATGQELAMYCSNQLLKGVNKK